MGVNFVQFELIKLQLILNCTVHNSLILCWSDFRIRSWVINLLMASRPHNFKKLVGVAKFFLRGSFFSEGGGTHPIKVIDLPRAYENLLCKGEPYWFSGYRDPKLQTDRIIEILLLFLFVLGMACLTIMICMWVKLPRPLIILFLSTTLLMSMTR